MTIDPNGGISPSSPTPPKAPPTPSQATGPSAPNSGNLNLSDSPFAKMFQRAGMTLDGEQMKQMIDGLLKMQIADIKRQESSWKESMRKIKDAWEGNDS